MSVIEDSPNASKLRACLRVQILHSFYPSRYNLTGRGSVFILPFLKIKIWLCGRIVFVLPMLRNRILRQHH